MKYTKHLSQPWFECIYNGSKTVEGRLNKGDFGNMQIGDQIEFHNENNKYTVDITNIKYYKTFKEMITKERLKHVLPTPDIKRIKDGVKVYHSFYSPEDEKQYGIVAIHIKVKK